ncbi:nitric oxide reductase transcriptional regulator NorR [Derxia lacustris]|uniref:nitric oxide reductase transcriptional regulator NorR n=1 Tax=Derxia lacustris TaxID=764842 RepID=UPI000A171C85|nr:nitric oxide reductase transcriptional regulator NorR [Derxia lacustris]
MTSNDDFLPIPAASGGAIADPATDSAARYRDLLAAVRRLVDCDAAALLRLDGDALVPAAIDGLAEETLARRFAVADHPRLATLLAARGPWRFAPDTALPDPYDGLIADQPALLPVHDCLGAPLRAGGRLWGVVTLDALTPGAFDAVPADRLRALVALVESGIDAALAIERLAERAERAGEVARSLGNAADRRELVGSSAALRRLRAEIATVAASDLTVLVQGETGAGKELVARELHARSARRDRPLVQLNCAALPETLAESELFGHRKGAFTGAVADRSGRFELADGGTLFLDEVGELPPAVQAKLLRALQSGEVQRLGSDHPRRVDVRVIAATNRDLRAEVAAGHFRADLYHRLAVFPLSVPPLRERGRDVIALANAFLEENQHRLGARNFRLGAAAREALLGRDWPGNVRELEHAVARAALRALAEQGRRARWIGIEPAHLGLDAAAESADAPVTAGALRATGVATEAAPAGSGDGAPAAPAGLRAATDAFQRDWIAAALARHAGNLAAAAREAGMDRGNFHRLVRRLGLGRD